MKKQRWPLCGSRNEREEMIMGLYAKMKAQSEIVRAAKRLNAFLVEHVTDDSLGLNLVTCDPKIAVLAAQHLADLKKAIAADK